MPSCKTALLVAVLITLGSPAAAGDRTPDARVTIPILLKVVTYDRNFGARGNGDFVMMVVSDTGHERERREVIDVVKGLGISAVNGRKLKVVGVELRDKESLTAQAKESRASAILAVPGLSVVSQSTLSEVAREKQLYSLALDHQMVHRHLAIGVAAKDGRPQIVINAAQSKHIGAAFDAAVLRLAQVIR